MHHIQGCDRDQTLLLPNSVADYIGPDNPVRFVEVFVDQLDLQEAGFCRVEPKETGRPGYDPADLLKLYIYGYLNRVRSSRRLEAETRRNLEVIWLLLDRGAVPEDIRPSRDSGFGALDDSVVDGQAMILLGFLHEEPASFLLRRLLGSEVLRQAEVIRAPRTPRIGLQRVQRTLPPRSLVDGSGEPALDCHAECGLNKSGTLAAGR